MDAELVISHAKELRNASDEYVRAKVYINADLTTAEAKAAYEQRCPRRQREFVSSDLQRQRQRADNQLSSQPADHQHDQQLDRRHSQQKRIIEVIRVVDVLMIRTWNMISHSHDYSG